MILLSSSFESVVQLLGALLIFLFVLAVTYFTTRWIGNYQKINSRNKNLHIMEALSVGNNKQVAMIKAGEVYLVIAVGKDEVTLLAQLTAEQLTEIPSVDGLYSSLTEQSKMPGESFKDILDKVKDHFPKK